MEAVMEDLAERKPRPKAPTRAVSTIPRRWSNWRRKGSSRSCIRGEKRSRFKTFKEFKSFKPFRSHLQSADFVSL
jgi:hypothetical protein